MRFWTWLSAVIVVNTVGFVMGVYAFTTVWGWPAFLLLFVAGMLAQALWYVPLFWHGKQEVEALND